MKNSLAVFLCLFSPSIICVGAIETLPLSGNEPIINRLPIFKLSKDIFVVYDCAEEPNQQQTPFIGEIGEALDEIGENKIGLRAIKEIKEKVRKIVIIPSDFLLRLFTAFSPKANLSTLYLRRLDEAKVFWKFFRMLDNEEHFQIITKLVDALNSNFLSIVSNEQHENAEERGLMNDIIQQLFKFLHLKESLLGQDIFGNSGYSTTIDVLSTLLQKGSCFVKPTDAYQVNLIAIDRNWRHNKKLLADKNAFSSSGDFVQICPEADEKVGATLFHELNHCRHFYKYGSTVYQSLTVMTDGISSLGLLCDRSGRPLPGIFTNHEEELQLIGSTLDKDGEMIIDDISELGYRLSGQYKVRYPYCDPTHLGELYLSREECGKLTALVRQ